MNYVPVTSATITLQEDGGKGLLKYFIYQDLNPKKITFRKDKARKKIKKKYKKISPMGLKKP